MRLPALLAACLALTLPLGAQSRFGAALHIGTVDSVWSPTLKEQRPYLVYTPPSYGDTTVTPQRYPVLYLLDGDAHFHSVSGLVQILGTGVNGTYAVPEMIVVAIPNTNRMRDLSPTRPTVGYDGKPAGPEMATAGGMGNFLTFISKELIPQVESRYRTMPYRVFVGHSLGGITVIQALYTMPEVFHAYVAIDPSLWWDRSMLLRQAKPWITAAKLPGKALFMAQANTISAEDSVTNPHYSAMTQFNAVMEKYNRSGLRYAYRNYPDDDHGSVPLIAEYDAFRFIFRGYKPDLLGTIAEPRSLLTHYQRISEQLGATFTPAEGTLRLLGTVAMGQDTTKALEFRAMATELYPQSWRAWDQLGALSLARRDTVRAREAFRRSAAINPKGKVAEAMLQKVGR